MSDGTAQVGILKVLRAIVWIVYALAVAAVIVLAFAFFLLMFNASTNAPFVAFVYKTAARFSEPFVGMIKPTKLTNGGQISWSALFAIAAYAVLAWLFGIVIDSISRSIGRRSRARATVPSTAPATSPAQVPAASGQTAAAPSPQPSVQAGASEVQPPPAESPQVPAAPAANTEDAASTPPSA